MVTNLSTTSCTPAEAEDVSGTSLEGRETARWLCHAGPRACLCVSAASAAVADHWLSKGECWAGLVSFADQRSAGLEAPHYGQGVFAERPSLGRVELSGVEYGGGSGKAGVNPPFNSDSTR